MRIHSIMRPVSIDGRKHSFNFLAAVSFMEAESERFAFDTGLVPDGGLAGAFHLLGLETDDVSHTFHTHIHVSTPGHTPRRLSFAIVGEESAALVTGDLFAVCGVRFLVPQNRALPRPRQAFCVLIGACAAAQRRLPDRSFKRLGERLGAIINLRMSCGRRPANGAT